MVHKLLALLLLGSGVIHVAVIHAQRAAAEEREARDAIAADERDGLVVRCVRAETVSGCAHE